MIFAIETQERALTLFESETAAVAACEGLDVEDGVWQFWSDDGMPLEPVFTVPNRRGALLMQSGVYHFRGIQGTARPSLAQAISTVRRFPAQVPFDTAAGVLAYVEQAARRKG